MNTNHRLVRDDVASVFEGKPFLLTVSQVASILGISRASVYRLSDTGRLHAMRPVLSGNRGSVRIARDSVERLLHQWVSGKS